MDYWQEFQQKWLGYVPLFLLTLGCGIDSGRLMAVAFLCHLLICKKKKLTYFGTLRKDTKVRQTVLVIAFSLLCAAVTLPFNHGQGGLLLKYIERMIPLALVIFLVRPSGETFKALWFGILTSMAWYIGDICLHPVWRSGRLVGSFGSPNSLAGIMLILIPIGLFGVIRYRCECPKAAVVAMLLTAASLCILVCTGSRNAYLSFAIIFILCFYMIWRHQDWMSIKILAVFVIVVGLAAAIAAPGLVSQRLQNNVQRDGRVYLMKSAVQLIEEKPLVGIGLGNWGRVYRERFEADNPNHEIGIQSPHNIYLQVWNETGLIGFIGFLSLIGFQLGSMIRALRQFYRRQPHGFPWLAGLFLPLLAIFLFGLMDYDFFSRHMMHLYWFYWGFCLYAMLHYVKEI